MADDVIKQFLVSLGWKVDSEGQKKFEESMERAHLRAELMARAIEKSIDVFAEMLKRVIETYEKMFWMSERVNASVANIQSFSKAVADLGGSVQSANQGLEAFGRFLRVNPGGYNFIESFGIKVRDAKGNLRDTTDILREFTQSQKGQPYGYQMRLAQRLGVPEDVWRAIQSGEFDKRQQRHRSFYDLLGLNQEQVAHDAEVLTRQLREIGSLFEAIITKVMANVMHNGEEGLAGFIKWMEKHAPAIVDVLENFVRGLIALAKAIPDAVDAIEQWLRVLRKIEQSTDMGMGPLVRQLKDFIAQLHILNGLKPPDWLLRWLGISPANAAPAITPPAGGSEPSTERSSGGWGIGGTLRRTWDRLRGAGGGEGVGAPEGVRRRGERMSARALPPYSNDLATAIKQSAKDLGINPEDLATMISFETGGTFDKWKAGPRTKWGQHRGLIQWGEPQARQYGVTANSTVGEQMAAVTQYLKDRGVKPGMNGMNVYAAINAGHASKTQASDAAAGGTWGTVEDKWKYQMAGHRKRARQLFDAAEAEAKKTETPPSVAQNPLFNAGGMSKFPDPRELKQKFLSQPMGTGGTNSWSQQNNTVTQNNNITVQGGTNPQETAAEISKTQSGQTRELGNMLRNNITSGAR